MHLIYSEINFFSCFKDSGIKMLTVSVILRLIGSAVSPLLKGAYHVHLTVNSILNSMLDEPKQILREVSWAR